LPTTRTRVPSTPRFRALDMPRLPDNGLVRHDDGSVWLATRHELFGGRTLLLEQSLDQLLTLSGSTLRSVLARSLLLILALMLVRSEEHTSELQSREKLV